MGMFTNAVLRSIYFSFSLILLGSCGSEQAKKLGVGEDKQEIAAPTGDQAVLAAIGVSRASLALDGTDGIADWEIDISGCKSGFTTTVTSTTATPKSSVALYRQDQSCIAELVSFTWDSKTWTMSGGSGLSAGSDDFQDGSGNTLRVFVDTQLASPAVDGLEARFIFTEILSGDNFTISDYAYSETLTVDALEAPNMSIHHMDLTAIDATNGKATFDVSVECEGTLSQSGSDCSTAIGGVNQRLVRMKVAVLGATTGIYADGIDYAEATAAIDDHAEAVAAGDLEADLRSDGVADNGGFTVSVEMNVGPLYSHKTMVVLVEYRTLDTPPASGDYPRSYRWFSVSIGEPSSGL